MTDTYLRSLGFAPTARPTRASRAAFGHSWRYQFDHVATDGTPLFLEHALGIDHCRLSAVEAPLTATDVFATIGLHDRPALAAAMQAFFVAHQGMGQTVTSLAPSIFVPFRRKP